MSSFTVPSLFKHTAVPIFLSIIPPGQSLPSGTQLPPRFSQLLESLTNILLRDINTTESITRTSNAKAAMIITFIDNP
ncbi:MAG: hypothetical protein R6V53_03370 [Candidatus Woesearchaeota archaeon]